MTSSFVRDYRPPPLVPITEEGHPLSKCLLELEAEKHKHGWPSTGSPLARPQFFILYQDLLSVRANPQPLPEEAYQLERPHHMLKAMIHIFSTDPLAQLAVRELLSPRFLGVAVLVEAWMLMADLNDSRKVEEFERVSEARQVHTHPDRREVRMVNAVTIDGRACAVNRMRGHGDRVEVLPAVLDGVLAYALHELVLTMRRVASQS